MKKNTFLSILFVVFLFVSCATCEKCKEQCVYQKAIPYIQYAPIVIAPRPALPKYIILDDSKQIYDYEILKYLGYNIVEMKRYLNDLLALVDYYEKIAADYNAENDRLKKEAEEAAKKHNEGLENRPIQ